MRLVIKHNLRQTDRPGKYLFQATYYLHEPRVSPLQPLQLDQRLAGQKLSELAARWYLLNQTSTTSDANAALLAGLPEADTELSILIPQRDRQVFEFASEDPLLIAALDERVRRACAMILEDAVYEDYLSRTQEQILEFGADNARPSLSPLPRIEEADRVRVAKTV